MHLEVGDLVKRKYTDAKIGIVVKKNLANHPLSEHSKSIDNAYVYYVLFTSGKCNGPYYESELVLTCRAS